MYHTQRFNSVQIVNIDFTKSLEYTINICIVQWFVWANAQNLIQFFFYQSLIDKLLFLYVSTNILMPIISINNKSQIIKAGICAFATHFGAACQIVYFCH